MPETAFGAVSAPEDVSQEGSVHEDLAALFRALGHPARLAILQQLAARQGACCGQIVDGLPLAQSTVSQHLQVLKDVGLLVCAARGRNCHYHLNESRLREAERLAAAFWNGLKAAQAETPCPQDQNS